MSARVPEIDRALVRPGEALPEISVGLGPNRVWIGMRIPPTTMRQLLRAAGILAEDPNHRGQPNAVRLWCIGETTSTGEQPDTVLTFDDLSEPPLAARDIPDSVDTPVKGS